MPTPKKRKPAKKAAMTKRPDPDLLELVQFIAREMARISGALEQLVVKSPQVRLHRVGPSDLPGGNEEFMSGSYHRRAGNIYDKVASPGTPNAGDADADDTSGPV